MTKPEVLYVGSHRRAHRADPVDIAFGIYAFRKERESASLGAFDMAETPQPGWIAVHPDGAYLYVVNEVGNFDGEEAGGVSAFAIDPETGSLSPLNHRRTPPMPCHCQVDVTGRFLLVATFGGGSVHLFRLEPDGQIGAETDAHRHVGSSVHPRRQTHPHAHAVVVDPANRFVLVPDLGADRVFVYELDHEGGKLIPRPDRVFKAAPGSGPRHLTFDPRGRFAYLMNEMSATITTLAYDMGEGALREIQSVDTLPDGFAGLRSGAELHIHPAGRFLYASTRSHGSSGMPPAPGLDGIAWFAIDAETGMLGDGGRVPSGGQIPRSFAFDGSGEHLFVGHQCSGTIVTFKIDLKSGAPVAIGEVVATPVPVCLRFVTAN